MGKVKEAWGKYPEMRKMVDRYQFPMGKVKQRHNKNVKVRNRINSLWER